MQYMRLERWDGGSKYEEIDLTNNAVLTDSGYKLFGDYAPDMSGPERDVDKISLMVSATTVPLLMGKIRTIERLLEWAGRNQVGPNYVQVIYSPNYPAEAPWRSRITGGAVIYPKTILSTIEEKKAEIEVIFERMPFWEATTQETLTLTNADGSSENITLRNHNDGEPHGTIPNVYYDRFDFVVAAGEIKGNLPTPARIGITNKTNDAKKIANIYVGHKVFDISAYNNAEDEATLEAQGTADATCSLGEYAACPWTGTDETMIAELPVKASMYQHFYKLIARLKAASGYSDLYLKAKLTISGVVAAETPWTLNQATAELHELGSLRMPPVITLNENGFFDIATPGSEDMHIQLFAKRAGGDGTLNLDYIAMLPQDGWRHYKALPGRELEYNHWLVDDPRDGLLAGLPPGAANTPGITHIIRAGNPIMLQPNMINKLMFLHDCDDGTAGVDRTIQVNVLCYPRRRGL